MLDINKKFTKELINIHYGITIQKFTKSFCRIIEKDYTQSELLELLNLLKNTYTNYEFKLKYKKELKDEDNVIWYNIKKGD